MRLFIIFSQPSLRLFLSFDDAKVRRFFHPCKKNKELFALTAPFVDVNQGLRRVVDVGQYRGIIAAGW